MKRIIVAITGASGSIYGMRLIEELTKRDFKVHVVLTKTAEKVMEFETGRKIQEFILALEKANVRLNHVENLFADIASGSYKTEGMIVAPCSMGTLSRIANGVSSNLLERAAEVCLKEGRTIVLMPRETPLSAISLENMLKLSRVGVRIMPASPGFYHKPKSVDDLVDFMVGRALDSFGIENDLCEKWGGIK